MKTDLRNQDAVKMPSVQKDVEQRLEEIYQRLNENHRQWLNEFLTNGRNATRAYKKVYAPKNDKVASVRAVQLKKNKYIAEYLALYDQLDHKEAIATREERMQFLTKVMRGKLDTKVTTRDRIEAAKLLGTMQGDFERKKDQEAVVEFNFVTASEMLNEAETPDETDSQRQLN